MFVDPKDNNLIIEPRNQECVCKIDRFTGKVMWVLGGPHDQFNIQDKQQFYGAHDVQLTDEGNLLIFDNGNWDNQSRIVEFKLDEEDKEILDFKSFAIPGYHSEYTGSVQKLDSGNYLIGWGSHRNHEHIVSLVNPATNEILAQITTPLRETNIYRARWVSPGKK